MAGRDAGTRTKAGAAMLRPSSSVGICRALATAAIAVLFADRADALSCMHTARTLEQSYALAEGIVVAQVLGCADGAARRNGWCPDDRYHLETIETLKGPEPWRNLSGSYLGAGMSRCGPRFETGESYLLFVDASGSVISSAGGRVKGAHPQTREVQRTLAILRDFRDGRIADLPDPWIFTDTGQSCELKQRVGAVEISFHYQYTELQYAHGTDYDSDGNPIPINPRPVGPMFGEGIVAVVDGQQIAPRTLGLSVLFPGHPETGHDTATITVGNDTWSLETRTFSIHQAGREMGSLVLDFAPGEAALSILDAMLVPTAVTVRKRGIAQPGGEATQLSTVDDSLVVAETSTTLFAPEAHRFRDCVDGTHRSPLF